MYRNGLHLLTMSTQKLNAKARQPVEVITHKQDDYGMGSGEFRPVSMVFGYS